MSTRFAGPTEGFAPQTPHDDEDGREAAMGPAHRRAAAGRFSGNSYQKVN